MLIVYAADSSNVTVSPRLGTGHVEPQFNSDASIFVLEGTGIGSDGSLVANIRCDTCLSWSGGSMDPTSTSSSWIYAYKSGSAIDSTSSSADISQHDGTGQFNLNLVQGTGGSSSNPFVASSDGSSSAAPSATGSAAATGSQTGSASQPTGTDSGATTTASTTATATGGVSVPLASSNPSSSGISHFAPDPNKNVRVAHAVIMSLVFVLLFPLSALTIYLPYHEKVRHIHAPLQLISLVLMLIGFGTGVQLAKRLDITTGYHQIVGYIVVVWMVLIQPALGLGQHLHFRKTGTRSPMGHVHRWLGRIIIILGIVNGGLGFMQAGPVGQRDVPTYSVIVYGIFAGLIFLVYLAVLIMSTFSAQRTSSLPGEKPRPRTEGYEMHNGRDFERPRHPNA